MCSFTSQPELKLATVIAKLAEDKGHWHAILTLGAVVHEPKKPTMQGKLGAVFAWSQHTGTCRAETTRRQTSVALLYSPYGREYKQF